MELSSFEYKLEYNYLFSHSDLSIYLYWVIYFSLFSSILYVHSQTDYIPSTSFPKTNPLETFQEKSQLSYTKYTLSLLIRQLKRQHYKQHTQDKKKVLSFVLT